MDNIFKDVTVQFRNPFRKSDAHPNCDAATGGYYPKPAPPLIGYVEGPVGYLVIQARDNDMDRMERVRANAINNMRDQGFWLSEVISSIVIATFSEADSTPADLVSKCAEAAKKLCQIVQGDAKIVYRSAVVKKGMVSEEGFHHLVPVFPRFSQTLLQMLNLEYGNVREIAA